MNDLEKYFFSNSGSLIDKWHHYFDIYDRHFSRYRGTDVHVMEIGVFHGGSLQMWKDYFGPRAKIYGVDINPYCKQLEEDRVEIFIGNQEDRDFLQSVADAVPRIDILIDDGGHKMRQQITTFEALFPHIDKHGVYLCEDLHTSYWREFDGGAGRKGTFIEYSKHFIDSINAWHSRQPRKLKVSEFTRSAYSLHYYDSVLVIEKKPIEEPTHSQTGHRTLPSHDPNEGLLKRIKRNIKRSIKRRIKGGIER